MRVNIKPRTRTGLDEAPGLKRIIGLQNSRNANSSLAAKLAHRRQWIAWTQRARLDQLCNAGCNLLVLVTPLRRFHKRHYSGMELKLTTHSAVPMRPVQI